MSACSRRSTPRRTSGGRAPTFRRARRSCKPGRCSTRAASESLAALGLTDVAVFDKPRVAILSTGNEIVEPGQPLAPGQIYDINRFTLAAVVDENGGVAVPYRIATDTIEDLSRSVDECLEQDVLVFSGGSSVGERDLILDVITAKGEMLFHGIAVKPGKPTAFGRINGKLVFGMPGYPSSCLSNAHILLAPALRRIARLPEQIVRSLTLPLASRVSSVPGRHQFYTVRIANGLGGAGLQSIRRHHVHVEGRRLHRDPGRRRSRRCERAGRGEVVLGQGDILRGIPADLSVILSAIYAVEPGSERDPRERTRTPEETMSVTDVAVQEAGQRARTERIVNDFAIQVATVNGSGSQTANLVLLRSIFQMGVPVSGKNMFPSNIAGLPTWYTIRASAKGYIGRKKEVDFLVAMNAETAQEDVLTPGAWRRRRLRRAAEAERAAQRPDLLSGPVRQADAADHARRQAAPARAQHDLRRRALEAAVGRHGADGEGPAEAARARRRRRSS